MFLNTFDREHILLKLKTKKLLRKIKSKNLAAGVFLFIFKSFMVNISLDGRFLAVNVTPNPCPRHVCHFNDHCCRIPMDRMLLIGKHFANEGF